MAGRLIPVVLAVALAATACGSASTSPSTVPAATAATSAPDATQAPAATTVGVSAPPPAIVEIRRGVVHPSTLDLGPRDSGIVEFRNNDDTPRTVTSRTGDFEPFEVPAGGTAAFDFGTLPAGIHRFWVEVGNARNPGLVDTSLLGGETATAAVRSWDGRVGLRGVTDTGDWRFLGVARGIVGSRGDGWAALQRALLTGAPLAPGLVVTWEDPAGDPAAAGEARLAADALPENCGPGAAQAVTIGGLAGAEEQHDCNGALLIRGYVAGPQGPVVHYRMAAATSTDRIVVAEARASLQADPGAGQVAPPDDLAQAVLSRPGADFEPGDFYDAHPRITLEGGVSSTGRLDLGPWHAGPVTIVNRDPVAYEVLTPGGSVATVPAGAEHELTIPGDGWMTLVGDDLRLVPLLVDPSGLDAGDRLVRTDDSGDGVTIMHLDPFVAGRWIFGSFGMISGLALGSGDSPAGPQLSIDVVEAGLSLTAEEGAAVIDRLLDEQPVPGGCAPPDRAPVEYGGWPGHELLSVCPDGEVRIGVLHRAGADVLVTYTATTQTDEDRWHVATALETMEIDR